MDVVGEDAAAEEVEEPTSTNSLNLTIPRPEDDWVLYFDERCFRGQTKRDFMSNLRNLGTLNPQTDIQSLLPDIEDSPDHKVNLRVFRSGVTPCWDNAANIDGGRVICFFKMYLPVSEIVTKFILATSALISQSPSRVANTQSETTIQWTEDTTNIDATQVEGEEDAALTSVQEGQQDDGMQEGEADGEGGEQEPRNPDVFDAEDTEGQEPQAEADGTEAQPEAQQAEQPETAEDGTTTNQAVVDVEDEENDEDEDGPARRRKRRPVIVDTADNTSSVATLDVSPIQGIVFHRSRPRGVALEIWTKTAKLPEHWMQRVVELLAPDCQTVNFKSHRVQVQTKLMSGITEIARSSRPRLASWQRGERENDDRVAKIRSTTSSGLQVTRYEDKTLKRARDQDDDGYGKRRRFMVLKNVYNDDPPPPTFHVKLANKGKGRNRQRGTNSNRGGGGGYRGGRRQRW
eukprot:TRINITY_DN67176_c11_g5_i1.p1 TRINITY_DN67176_c11_g5~~TRINITY_DN67176_c11_g5_i1.p1  ORF type:complete len:532 (-),score=92.69 TRINITY_DN67176_c11_g5_i1:97-1476(-)